jgi:hypothetical protein
VAKEPAEPRYISGFCGTKYHHNCKYVLTYYDKSWTCQCECHIKPDEEQHLTEEQ